MIYLRRGQKYRPQQLGSLAAEHSKKRVQQWLFSSPAIDNDGHIGTSHPTKTLRAEFRSKPSDPSFFRMATFQHPRTGRPIRVIRSEAALWRNEKTVCWLHESAPSRQ